MLLIRTPEDARELRLHLPSSNLKKSGPELLYNSGPILSDFQAQKKWA
jgi:hypothetical protein